MAAIPMPLRTLAWVACVFCFGLIAFGAFVRLSDAGLSCPDWPTCYGHITWPVKPGAVAKADEAFPNRPVETHRAWREQTHRFLAGTLGLLVLAEALVATFARKRRFGLVIVAVILIGIGIPLYMAKSYVSSSVIAAIGEALLLAIAIFWRGGGWRRIAVLTLAVVCFQALLGMWTVTWLLLPLVVTAHLLGGMLTFGLLAWLAWRLSFPQERRLRAASLLVPAAVGLVLLSCQIFLGGWTSTNYAALACGVGSSAFPECLGQWWPAMDFHHGFILLRHIGVDFQGGILDAPARTAIQMVHRLGALVVFVYLLWLAHRSGRAGMRWHAIALAVVLVAQVALGISNVTLGLPLWVAVAHTAVAALLLFVVVTLLTRAQGPLSRSQERMGGEGERCRVPTIRPRIESGAGSAGARDPRRLGLRLSLPGRGKGAPAAKIVARVRKSVVSTLAGQYLASTKPRIVVLLTFTAVIGMLLAAPGVPPWRALVFGTLGIWMASSAAAALNQLIDQRIDRVMARTAHRPLVTGTLTTRQVLTFALALGIASMLVLALLVNWLTALLTFIGLIGYAVIYTAFLKRATPQNIVIGGLAGAVPPLLGWAAVTGMQAPSDWAYGFLLVLIVFAWTPPHFWALAIFRREDYRRACIPMLPVVYGVEYTRWHVLFYTILLVLVSFLPVIAGMSGMLYLGGAAVLGIAYLYYAIRLLRPPNERFAMAAFGYSIVYLYALFAFLLADHWLATPMLHVGGYVLQRVG